MRLPLFLFLFLYYFSVQGAPDCEKCDMETVRVTQENLSGLTFAMVQEFLCTFDEGCEGDIEFSRLSNETLFDLVYNAPELFLKVLQFGQLKNQDLILQELSSPAHAGINVDLIRSKIKKQDEKYMFKYDVLSALD
jgi:hypothetical protein